MVLSKGLSGRYAHLLRRAAFPLLLVTAQVAAAGIPSAAILADADKRIQSDTPRLTAMYKDIHQNAELGFQEVRTAGIVAKELKALGFEVKTSIGKTGVVGILRNGPGPVVMYRGLGAGRIRQ